MDFIAFDFETTGGHEQYPCSLGITIVEDNKIVKTLHSLINPECHISKYTSENIHHITDSMVKDAPTFPELWEQWLPLFNKYGFAFAHNCSFDRDVMLRSCERYNLKMPACFFLCTMNICKELMPGFPRYSLDFLCKIFSIEQSNHHDAGEDSEVTAILAVKLLFISQSAIILKDKFKNLQVEDVTYEKPENKKSEHKKPELQYDDVNKIVFDGCKFVITGDFEGYSRNELKEIITQRGGKVAGSVSSRTDYLIVGYENLDLVTDTENAKSGKIIAAEEFKAKGAPIKIIDCDRFISFIKE